MLPENPPSSPPPPRPKRRNRVKPRPPTKTSIMLAERAKRCEERIKRQAADFEAQFQRKETARLNREYRAKTKIEMAAKKAIRDDQRALRDRKAVLLEKAPYELEMQALETFRDSQRLLKIRDEEARRAVFLSDTQQQADEAQAAANLAKAEMQRARSLYYHYKRLTAKFLLESESKFEQELPQKI